MRLLLILMLLVAGCRDHRPPAPTAQDNARLDEADRALNEMATNEAH